MAIEILELHHHAVSMPTAKAHAMGEFYQNVLGMDIDTGRWEIKGVPGFFIDVGDDRQIHLLGKDGLSPFAQGPGKDPADSHVAFAVRDINEAEAELKRLGVDYFQLENAAAPDLRQLFIKDPAGNHIELHQIGTCRCKRSDRALADAKMAALKTGQQ